MTGALLILIIDLMQRHRIPLALGLSFVILISACGTNAGESSSDLRVVASFYPLEWVSQRVAGNRADVTSLTPPGAEPHDLELSPQNVGTMTEADLLLYLSGFQPAVDEAVATAESAVAVDARELTSLDLTAAEEGEEHADEVSSTDPHFWLDPLRLAEVGDALADRMAEVDPAGAEVYEQNAADLRADLEALDEDMATGLSDCESTDLVTSHRAFGYLAERYGLTQVGIRGLSPEDEPSPAELADVTDFVRDNDVDTIYFETLVNPDVAQTVAEETGADTATLDPVEGLTESSAGDDYLEVMRSNLATLREGQSCT